MTREQALAFLASGSMSQGALLEYEPGVLLVVDHPLGGVRRIAPRVAPEHIFEARGFDGTGVNEGHRAWGYYVDVNS